MFMQVESTEILCEISKAPQRHKEALIHQTHLDSTYLKREEINLGLIKKKTLM